MTDENVSFQFSRHKAAGAKHLLTYEVSIFDIHMYIYIGVMTGLSNN